MRIGIITCNNANNYGARLQAFGLYRYLTDNGFDVEIIDYLPVYVSSSTKLFYNPGLNIREWLRFFKYFSHRKSQIRKQTRCEKFSHSHYRISPKQYHSAEDLKADAPICDIYIAGSDQIWNPTLANGHDRAYYLDFGSEEVKRISYAASFAIPKLSEEVKPFIVDNLKRLDHISVREESAVRILQGIGYESCVVCDPAFLLDADSWNHHITSDVGKGEKYILVYDFERSKSIQRAAKRIARLRGLGIYSVSPFGESSYDKNFTDCSPEDFVALIRNATCVLSNSLHGTIFSMIFKKDFYVVQRNDGLNVRMIDLLNRYSLNERIIDEATPDQALIDNITYDAIYQNLQDDIRRSKHWLLSSCNS